MPAPCSSCHHPEREELDRALVLGQESLRSLARRYQIDRASLSRHRDRHLSAALVKLQAEREEAGPRSALDRYEELYDAVATAVYGSESLPPALVRELRGVLDSIARIRGEIDERPQVAINVLAAPEFLQTIAVLQAALRPYPAASEAVGAALAGLPTDRAALALPGGGAG